MTIVLRAIAVVVGFAVALTALVIVQFAARGMLGSVLRHGALGVITLVAWLTILAVGPVAAIQLWRLRRIGLLAAALLCGLAIVYYVTGVLFLRTPQTPILPLLEATAVNGALLAFLLSSAARRHVS